MECRQQKQRQWLVRMSEELRQEPNAYFITLTYNNEHLPENGVFPEEIQLFIKRLRTKLDRRGISHNLRYIAVSEYGHWSKRPHYHIILWNFPVTISLHY